MRCNGCIIWTLHRRRRPHPRPRHARAPRQNTIREATQTGGSGVHAPLAGEMRIIRCKWNGGVKCNGGLIKPCLISAQPAAAATATFPLREQIAEEIDQTKAICGPRGAPRARSRARLIADSLTWNYRDGEVRRRRQSRGPIMTPRRSALFCLFVYLFIFAAPPPPL